MAVTVIDYGMGNLHSVSKAVERLGYQVEITPDPEQVARASTIILPGVGAFGDAMEQLRAGGLDEAVVQAARGGVPLLGICLGMQLLFAQSEEHGLHEGLHLLPGKVIRFRGEYKVPHMGWNRLRFRQPHPLLEGMEEGHVYFVHSYRAVPEQQTDLLATTDYYQDVTAIVGRNNVYGMQFHPEKSGRIGMGLLERFLALANSLREERGDR